MRIITLIVATALTTAPLAAQTTALAVGRGRAIVRVEATARIPVYLRATETVAFATTHQAATFTEHLATFRVRGNAAWTLDATALPAGVTVLDERGDWVSTPATIGRGEVTNGADILVRVRVSAEAPANWREQLRLEPREL